MRLQALDNPAPMTFVPDRYAYPTVSAGPTTPLPAMVRQHFTVAHEAVNAQAIAWSDYVGRILDAPVSRSQVEHGFRGDLDACVLPDMIYLDSRTDRLIQARTGARISRDSMRDFVFHVAVHGMLETHVKQGLHTRSTQFVPGILALDMAQPMRMVRPTGTRTLAFFLPRAMVESEIADAQSIHGRVIAFSSLSASPIPDLLFALCHQLSSMPAEEAATSIRTCAHLILGAFGKQHDLSLRTRNAARQAIQIQVRNHVQANLHNARLSPESIMERFTITRPTLYRMFEEEGGLVTYIRNCRLWASAVDLVRQPDVAAVQVGYSFGFGSASDFSRAFRRAFGVAPQEYRAHQFRME